MNAWGTFEESVPYDTRNPMLAHKSNLSYKEMEDLYYTQKHENVSLKKQLNDQEDKLKQMSTKLIKIQNDMKQTSRLSYTNDGTKRDIATEELIKDLQKRLDESQKSNNKLSSKVMYLQAAQHQNSKMGKYPHVSSRVDTGVRKSLGKNLIPLSKSSSTPRGNSAGWGVMSPRGAHYGEISTPTITQQQGLPPPQHIHHYTETVTQETKPPGPSGDQLVNILISNPSTNLSNEDHKTLYPKAAFLLGQLALNDYSEEVVHLLTKKVLEQDVEIHKYRSDIENHGRQLQALHDEEVDLKQEINRLQDENRNLKQVNSTLTPSENVDQLKSELLKLQREIRERAMDIAALQSTLEREQMMHKGLKENYKELLEQSTTLNQSMKEEKRKNLALEQQLKTSGSTNTTFFEMNKMIEELRAEKRQLEDSHNKLRASAKEELEQKNQEHEKDRSQLRKRISELEAVLKANEVDSSTKIAQAKELLDKIEQLKAENERQRKEKEETKVELFQLQQQNEDLKNKLNFFTSENGAEITEIREAINYLKLKKSGQEPLVVQQEAQDNQLVDDLKSQNAELAQKLLKLQENINVEYKNIAEDEKFQKQALRKEYEMKLEDEARLLDIKTDRIRKLETQLNNYIYKRIQMEEAELEGIPQPEEDLELKEGENVFEFYVHTFEFASGLPSNIDTFVSVEFYDYDVLVTPVLSGPKVDFNYVARYIFKVEDFFFYYLKYHTFLLELYHAQGLDCTPLASCFVSCRELLDKTGKIHGRSELISINDNVTVLGTIQYSFRIVRPITEEVKVWKTKMATLNLAIEGGSSKHQRHMSGAVHRNELIIKILSCKKLKPNGSDPPAVFVHYQFYEFLEHMTDIVSGFDPVFTDSESYTVVVGNELEYHLTNTKLEFTVFDDNDTTGEFYFGTAEVPLISLVHDKMIRGDYTIQDNQGNINGTISVELYWRHPYVRAAMAATQRLPPAPTPQLKPAPKSEPQILQEQFQGTQQELDLNQTGTTYKEPINDQFSQVDSDQGEVPREGTLDKSGHRSSSSNQPIHQPDPEQLYSESDINPSEGDESQFFVDSRNQSLNMSRSGGPASRQSLSRSLGSSYGHQRPFPRIDANIEIVIHQLELDPIILNNKNTENIFVSYEFLKYPEAELETQSLPNKQKPFNFNLAKEFPVYDNRHKLLHMLQSKDNFESTIIFDVFNEKDVRGKQLKKCTQLGTAEVNLKGLLDLGEDLYDYDLSVRDREGNEIGTLFVTVVAVDALRLLLDTASNY